MRTVSSPGVGFGQVVGAGINLVDGKEPWASSTCMTTSSLVKMQLHTPALHCEGLSAFSGNVSVQYTKIGCFWILFLGSSDAKFQDEKFKLQHLD